MPIIVTCQCGKMFRVRDEHAGKHAKCPGCGAPLTIVANCSDQRPALHVELSPLAEAVEQALSQPNSLGNCPGCHAALPEGATFCVQCGLDVTTGRRAVTKIEPAPLADRFTPPVSDSKLFWVYGRFVEACGTVGAVLLCVLVVHQMIKNGWPRGYLPLSIVTYPGGALAIGSLTGVTLACACAPRGFFSGRWAGRWLTMIGTRNPIVARVVSAAFATLGMAAAVYICLSGLKPKY